jgi:hypothetical protein
MTMEALVQRPASVSNIETYYFFERVGTLVAKIKVSL